MADDLYLLSSHHGDWNNCIVPDHVNPAIVPAGQNDLINIYMREDQVTDHQQAAALVNGR
jgi:hypothetical protein